MQSRSRRDAPPDSLTYVHRTYKRGVIAAVVFDIDGVIVDSEQVWDDVRERYVREVGGTLHRLGDARHDGHELGRVVALHGGRSSAFPGTPEEINAAIVERMLERYGEAPPLIPGAVDAVRRVRGALAARRSRRRRTRS